jgi:hypothetical protein
MDPPDKGYKAFDEMPKLFLCGVACEPAGSVEGALGTGHEKASAAPGRRSQAPQNRQPCVLAEDRAEAAKRCAEYRDRLSAENPTDVGRRPREPVNCVLEHARHRVVVFGSCEEQPIRSDDRLLQRQYLLGYPVLRFDISVVERNPMDCLDRELRAVWHELRRRTKQRGIE